MRLKSILLSVLVLLFVMTNVSADTLVGGGYSVAGNVSPITGSVSGGGYVVNQAGEPVGGLLSGGGYNSSAGTRQTVVTVVTPTTSDTNRRRSSGGGGRRATTTVAVATTTKPVTATTTPVTSTPACTEDIFIIHPIRYGFQYVNDPADVRTVENFLNRYEGERLLVNGIYELHDYQAVIKWQEKYRTNVLTPWGITQGTGYVFTTSMAQMRRQQVAKCKTTVPVVVKAPLACPYFTRYATLGAYGSETKKIQQFLNLEMGTKLVITGKFDLATRDVVKAFQKKYAGEVLSFWKLQFPTGNWYETTRKKANLIVGCKE